MADYKIFMAGVLTWVLCGLGFADAAKALDIEVFTVLPDGQMVNLPNGAFLYRGQRIRLSVKAEKTGRLIVRYFEGGSQATEPISLTIKDPLKPHYFPSQIADWRLTGDPGSRSFEVVLQSNGSATDRTQWSGEYVVPNQARALAKQSRIRSFKKKSLSSTGLVASGIPKGLANALADLKTVSVERQSTVQTRGGGEGSVVFAASAPSIVKVFSEDGIGSGVVLSTDGLIVTNYHVIEGSSEGAVLTLPTKGTYAPVFRFTIAGSFPLKDLAFIKVEFDKEQPIRPIKIGSSKFVDVGDQVYSIGHPHGFNWSLTRGIISAKRNNHEFGEYKGKKRMANVLQTQTPISPGNSGGALLNRYNKLIGINTFSRKDSQNLNFAISADEVSGLLADLKQIKINAPEKPTLHPDNGQLVKKIDQNGDGVFEVIIYNVFGHEEGDWFLIDVDEDGIIDRVDIDRDGNGIIEEHQRFQYDGRSYEKVRMIDNDADGKWDFMLVDKNLDGVDDTYRILN
jgi:S1-C subfamily serine protease